MDWTKPILKALPRVLNLTMMKIIVRKPSNFRSGKGMTMVIWWKATWSLRLKMGWSCGTAEYIDLKKAFSLNVRNSKIFYLIRANLNSNEIFLHVHYSENYKSKKQSEIPSAYFGQSAFSWFTACPYDRCFDSDKIKTMPIIIISGESDKSHVSAKTCVIKVIEHVMSEIPYSINTVYVVSDVCASQFR